MKRHWNMNHAINSKERFEKVPKRSKFELSKIENKAKKRPAVSKIHKCKFCKKTFDSTNNLRIHEQTIHDQKKQITCRYCDDTKTFSNKPSLQIHYKRIHKDKYYIFCQQCDKAFMGKRPLKKHIKRNHNHECNICDKTFTSYHHLSNHKNDIHKILDNGKSKRGFCDQVFKEPSKLKSHIELVHEGKKITCNYCDDNKVFAGERVLQLHIEGIHHERKAIKCQFCVNSYSFPRKNALKRHIRDVHENKRDKECHICHKTFKRPYHLTGHLESVHLIRNDKTLKKKNSDGSYTCDICGRCFSSSVKLNAHTKITHTQKPPRFKCSICSKVSNNQGSMQHHINIVHNAIKFRCDICKREVVSKTNLKLHIAAFHGTEKKNECKLCHKSYSEFNTLKNHIQRVHDGKKMFKCTHCKKEFHYSYQFKKHNVEFHEQTFDDNTYVTVEEPETNIQSDISETSYDPLKIETPDLKIEPLESDPLATPNGNSIQIKSESDEDTTI